MKTAAITLLTALLASALGHATEPAPGLLSKKLQSLAGPNSQDCGTVSLPGSLDAAIACAKDAAATGKAYRLAVELQGADSFTWQGAARGEHGTFWVVFYDADASSGSAASPTLSVLSCRAISFSTHRDNVLDCQPTTGER